LVAGSFPSPIDEEQRMTGQNINYLKNNGGEALSSFHIGQKIEYTSKNNELYSATVILVKSDTNGILDFTQLFPDEDYKAAYAYTELKSDEDQLLNFLLGSDDGVKVWLNGELVFENDIARGVNPREDRFSVNVNQGINKLLIKVTQYVRGWGLIVEVLDSEKYLKIIKKEKEEEEFLEFLDCKLEVKPSFEGEINFHPGEFPKLRWNKPYLFEKFAGDVTLNIRWFDSDLNEVSVPENPGRYAYYAEGKTKNNQVIRRSRTLYCYPYDWWGWGINLEADLQSFPISSIKKEVWEKNKKNVSLFIGRMLTQSMLKQTETSVLLSYLTDQDNISSAKINTPSIMDLDYHVALKKKILNLESKWPQFQKPLKDAELNSTILRSGSPEEAGVKPEAYNEIKNVCEEWFRESGVPFDVCIVHNGIVVINEAFGEDKFGKFTINTPTEMASITKLLTGVLFGQFVDQGLIKIDDPIGNYLPGFPTTGEKAITARHLFTHTSGLFGHGNFGGANNPWLDNVISLLVQKLPVGQAYYYNGAGYNLSGKVMEVISGKSVFRLMRENLFDPLEMKHTYLEEDLAYSCFSNAYDFAILGQMLLNKGTYRDIRFFSEETFDKLLPKQLSSFYPNVNNEAGIGMTWMRHYHPDAGKNGIPKDKTILSKNVIGHGSATSSILRVDLDNGLVITQSRREAGPNYYKYLTKLLSIIEENLKN